MFSEIISDMSSGAVDNDLTEQMEQVVKSVQETRLKGEMTIKIVFKPTGSNAIHVSTEGKIKRPRYAPPGSNYFATEDGALVRDDPRQQNLKFNKLEKPKLIELNSSAGKEEDDGNDQ